MADGSMFRRLALALPGVTEHPHFDRQAFKARVTFATLAPDGASANFKFRPDEQELKCLVAPEAFTPIDNAWGRQGWTRAELSALGEDELRAALETAFANAGPRAAKPKRRASRAH